MAESETAEITALKQEVIRLKQIVITMKYDIDNIDGDVMSLEDRITIMETDYTTQQQVRRLTQGEVAVMDRALLRSTRLVHAGELAPASTSEQPAPPAVVVDYTSVTAGEIVGCWQDKWEIDTSKVPEGAFDDLELEVRRALSAATSERRPDLFVAGEFTAHSGDTLPYKIECDALTDADIETLAREIARRFKFSQVIGVPRGGLRLAAALEPHRTHFSPSGVLIVDDVLTTGRSMEEARGNLGPNVKGVVIFARGPCPDWVTPLFSTARIKE